ncbi:MAG: phosphatase PAP2 family protein [Anaeroplasmataceae bacterium]|nr:phosphatase PAP2 family protein [Anaeroplasmataceae bacterium]
MLNFDLTIARFFASLREKAGVFFTPFFKIITYFGTIGLGFIITSIILLLFKKTRKLGVVSFGALIFGAIITNLLLKNIVARPRPFADEASEFYTIWKNAGSLWESGYSFPSGHATASMAFGFGLFLVCNKKYSWAFLFIPIIMGITRIYFCVHYATDVFGGLCVGIISGTLAFFTVKGLMHWKLFVKIMNAKGVTEFFKKKSLQTETPNSEDENYKEESKN